MAGRPGTQGGSGWTGWIFGVFALVLLAGSLQSSVVSRAVAAPGDGMITVTVIRDVNGNGSHEPDLEPGVSGMDVTVEDGDGGTVSATTEPDGVAVIDPASLTGSRYRVRVTIPPDQDYLQPAPAGELAPMTSYVDVADGASADLTVGVWNPVDYVQENPDYAIGVHSNIPVPSPDPVTSRAVQRYSYSDRIAPADPSDPSSFLLGSPVAPQSAVGTTYGLAYQRESGQLFMAAFAKRHAPYGPGGPGAIYVAPADGSGAPSVFTTVPNAGTTSHSPDLVTDFGFWDAPGKESLGGMALSPDGTELYVVNLNDRQLYIYDATQPSAPAPTAVVPIPDPGCDAAVNWRPFAVTVRDGIFVGGICSAESLGQGPEARSALEAVVYEFDGTSTFTEILRKTLDFQRGFTSLGFVNDSAPGVGQGRDTHWNSWIPTYNADNVATGLPYDIPAVPGTEVASVSRPQPILSSMAFDVDGSLILGFRDRFGDQSALGLPLPPSIGIPPVLPMPAVGTTGGDINKACINPDGSYSWEGTGDCPDNYDSNPIIGGAQLPGTVEYFPGDWALGVHHEAAQGAVAFPLQQQQLMSTMLDPNLVPFSGGVGFYDRDTGSTGFGELPEGSPFGPAGGPAGIDPRNGNTVAWALFGKSNGLGGLELLAEAAPVQVGGGTWFDENQDGIRDPAEAALPGVSVSLIDPEGTPISDTVSDDAGLYYFGPGESLEPETPYTVAFDYSTADTSGVPGAPDPATLAPSPTNVGDDPEIDSDAGPDGLAPAPTGPSGTSDQTVDAGAIGEPLQTCAVGDAVWMDENGDGLRDDAEPGVEGVTVTLLDTAGSPVGDPAITDADGIYSIDANCGDYVVQFSDIPPGTGFAPPNQGDDDTVDSDPIPDPDDPTTARTEPVTLDPSTSPDDTIDAGLVEAPVGDGTIGDFVWSDTNDDGIQDPDEPGIEGVTVTLLDADGNPVGDPQVTGPDGLYSFPGLDSGDYAVEFSDIPPGTSFSPPDQGDDDTTDSDPVPDPADPNTATTEPFTLDTETSPSNDTIDAGVVPPSDERCAVGDFVWDDTNGDGIQDAGEPGVEGVTVELVNPDGSPAPNADGTPVPATTTDADGAYVFDNLFCDDYMVRFTAPTGKTFTVQAQGEDPTVDSNPDASGDTPVFAVGPDDPDSVPNDDPGITADFVNPTVDAGVVDAQDGDGVVGDFVWVDDNEDGIQDPDEPGIPDATVTLFRAADDTEVDSTTTDAGGQYTFTGLPFDDYYVVFEPPADQPDLQPTVQSASGSTPETDSNPDDTGQTPDFPLSADTTPDNTIDAGYIDTAPTDEQCAVGDFVWDDANGDGLQDAGEPGVEGVSVELLNPDGSPASDVDGNPVSAAITDADGRYLFDNLTCGDYVARFTAPDGQTFTAQQQGDDPAMDSNPGASGETPVFTVASDDPDSVPIDDPNTAADFVNPTIDAGLVETPDPGLDKKVNGEDTTSEPLPVQPGEEITYTVTVENPAAADPEVQPLGAPMSGGTPRVLAGPLQTPGECPAGSDPFTHQWGSGNIVWPEAGNDQSDGSSQVFTDIGGSGVDATLTINDPDNRNVDGDNELDQQGQQASFNWNPAPTTQTVNDGYLRTAMNSAFVPEEVTWDLEFSEPVVIPDFNVRDIDAVGLFTVYPQDQPWQSYQDDVTFAASSGGVDVPLSITPEGSSGTPMVDGQTARSRYIEDANSDVDPSSPDGAVLVSTGNAPIDRFTWTYTNGPDDEATEAQDRANGGAAYPLPAPLPPDADSVSDGHIVLINFYTMCVQAEPEPLPALDKKVNGEDTLTEPLAVQPGDTVDYTITVTADDAPASGVTVDDVLPAGVTYAADDSGGAYDPATGTWTIGDMAAGESTTLTLSATVDDDAALGEPITNAAALSANGTPVPDNPPGSDPPSKNSSPTDGVDEVDIVPQDTAPPPPTGGVCVDDTLPAGVTLVSADADKGEYDPETGRWQIGPMTDGESVTLTIIAQVDEAAAPGDVITNTAELCVDDQPVPDDPPDSDPPSKNTAPTDGVDEVDVTVQPPGEGSIGDLVFSDTNGDGIQDPDEPGVEGVTVTLMDPAGNPVGDPVVTDPDGRYSFTGLDSGDYVVEFSDIPPGTSFSPPNQGDDDAVDSDPTPDPDDPDTAITEPFTLDTDANPNEDTIDAGVVPPSDERCAVGDFVWDDVNGDGLQDPDESGVEGVSVALLNPDGSPATDADGTPVPAATTDADGAYGFDNLFCDDYMVRFTAPTGQTFTAPAQGDDPTADSNPDASGDTPVFTVGPDDPDTVPNDDPDVAADFVNSTVDAGLVDAQDGDGVIGDFVWSDTNEDGIQDPDEPGLEDATVTLFRAADDTEVASTTTDAGGNYSFTELPFDDYYVVFEPPVDSGLAPTTQSAGDDPAADSNPDDTGQTPDFPLSADNTPEDTIDAGYLDTTPPDERCAVGDFVWEDTNGDGIQDAGEPGVEGVSVDLLNPDGSPASDADGNPVSAAVTDADGRYLFDNLSCGDYMTRFTAPDGQTFTAQQQGEDPALDSNPDASGDSPVFTVASDDPDTVPVDDPNTAADFVNGTVDAGLVDAQDGDGVVGDFVWNDTNEDGVQDPDEPGIENVTVTLFRAADDSEVDSTTTDAGGAYAFTGLDFDDYYVVFEPPADSGLVPTTQSAGDDPAVDSNPDDTGQTPDFPLAADNTPEDTIDAGYVEGEPPVDVCAVGDFVWDDTNGDGLQDAGEPGVEGVSVELLNPDGSAATDADGNPVSAAVTDADGRYLFDNLSCGDYMTRFTAPDGQTFTAPAEGDDPAVDSNPDGTGETPVFTVASDDPDTVPNDDPNTAADFVNATIDAGLVDAAEDGGTIGDFVWSDTNADGVQDPDEPGVEGVTVTLLDADGNPVGDPQLTDPDGLYSFTGLDSGEYAVQFSDTPPGSSFSPVDQGDDDTADSDPAPDSSDPDTATTAPFTLDTATSPTNDTIDAGIVPPSDERCAVGDFVWDDANGDGIQDAGEAGVEGVTVELLNPDGAPATDADGASVPAATTDADGLYVFDNLFCDDYMVRFAAPTGRTFTAQAQGDDPVADSNPDATGDTPVFTVGSNDPDSVPNDNPDLTADFVNSTIDAGLVDAAEGDGAVGDLVWSDLNEDGIQDPDEPGLEDVTVTLFRAADDTEVDSTPTDAGGQYMFTGLGFDDYYVVFEPPAGSGLVPTMQSATGSTPENDSNPDDTGQTPDFTLSADNTPDTTIDAGYVEGEAPTDEQCAVGDFVWDDTNGDGIQDAGEAGVAGVTVELLNPDGSPASDADGNPVSAVTTDADGRYLFDNLACGDYITRFTAPTGTTFTTPAQGDDPTVDSNPDASGDTPVFTVAPDDPDTAQIDDPNTDADFVNGTIDAGLVDAQDGDGAVGDFVWVDANQDGIQDDGEPGIEGATVTLFRAADDTEVDSTTTDAGGQYLFTGLSFDDYYVVFEPPADQGLEPTVQSADGSTPESDSNPDETGRTPDFTLSAETTPDNTIDAGYIDEVAPAVEITSPTEGDVINDATPPIEGTLDDPDATVDVVITDADGNPAFEGPASVDPETGEWSVTPDEELPDGDHTVAATATDPADNSATDQVRFSLDTVAPDAPEITSPGEGDTVGDDTPTIEGTGEPGATVTDEVTDADGTTTTYETLAGDDGRWAVEVTEPLADGPAEVVATQTDEAGNTSAPAQRSFGVDTAAAGDERCAVGDLVWSDLNGDGIQDDGEPGAGGASVELLNPDGSPASDADGNPVPAATTEDDGFYVFDNLSCGDYRVRFGAPSGSTFSSQNQGDDPAMDSNPDASGDTAVFRVAPDDPDSVANENGDINADFGNPTIDAGLVDAPGTEGRVSGRTWMDENRDGLLGDDEPGVEGLTATLFTPEGSEVATIVSGADGTYSLDDVPSGNYYLQFTVPDGSNLTFTTPNQGDDPSRASMADANGRTAVFPLSAGSPITMNAGLVPVDAEVGGVNTVPPKQPLARTGSSTGTVGILVGILAALAAVALISLRRRLFGDRIGR